jgi:hypothetical protein
VEDSIFIIAAVSTVRQFWHTENLHPSGHPVAVAMIGAAKKINAL